MTGSQSRPLYEALDELRTARDDLKRSSHGTFDGIFRRYAALLRPGTALGDTLEKILPAVDFDTFWKEGTTTIGGMVGTGRLDFPFDKLPRVAMQRELIVRMADDNPGIENVTYHFFYTGSKFSAHQASFVSQVIEPFQRDVASLVSPYLQEEKSSEQRAPRLSISATSFIDSDRIERFRELDRASDLDLRKLIRLCEEANLAFGNHAWHSVAFITRTILNHVPPAFGHKTFERVAAQASPKHFKVAAESLENFGRKVADFHLHETLAEHLALPTETQVNVAQQLDVVLAEVERALAANISLSKKNP
jgi:hypothetical protein